MFYCALALINIRHLYGIKRNNGPNSKPISASHHSTHSFLAIKPIFTLHDERARVCVSSLKKMARKIMTHSTNISSTNSRNLAIKLYKFARDNQRKWEMRICPLLEAMDLFVAIFRPQSQSQSHIDDRKGQLLNEKPFICTAQGNFYASFFPS